MRSVGLKVLNNKLSEYVRLAAAGETVLVTDRDRVVAEIVPPRAERSPILAAALLADMVRKGLLAPPATPGAGPPATALLGRIALLELSPPVLTRALGAFPVPVRTLDALHPASADYLRQHGQTVELATYDHRMWNAARSMSIPVSGLTA